MNQTKNNDLKLKLLLLLINAHQFRNSFDGFHLSIRIFSFKIVKINIQ